MQLTSIILLLSATVSVSALPAALEALADIDARDATGPASIESACDQSNSILSQQFDEMTKLKEQNIAIPPFLAGYYSAITNGRQEMGCPGTIPARKRQSTPKKTPCDVINGQLKTMTAQVNKFQKNNIGIAPYIAGFLSAAQDGHKALGCGAVDSNTIDSQSGTGAAVSNNSSISGAD